MKDLFKFASRGRRYERIVRALLGSSLIQQLGAGETSGTTVFDRSGNGRNGVFAGTNTLGVAGIGDGSKGVDMLGTGSVNCYGAGLAAAWNGAEGVVGGWFAANSAASWTNGSVYYLIKFGADDNNDVFLNTMANGTLSANYVAGGTVKTVIHSAQAGTRWVHYAIGWSKSGDRASLYINGAKQIEMTGLGTYVGTLASNRAQFSGAGSTIGKFPGRFTQGMVATARPSAAAMNQIGNSNTGVILFEGDSRTAGTIWPFAAADGAYPSGLKAYGGYGVASLATSGANYVVINARAAEVDARLVPGGKNVLVFWAGVNSGALGTLIYEDQLAYLQARKAAGWKIVWCKEIDANPANWHATNWPALNTKIRAGHSVADVLVDLGADARLMDYTNVTYFSDGIHLTAAGYGVVQTLVQAGLSLV